MFGASSGEAETTSSALVRTPWQPYDLILLAGSARPGSPLRGRVAAPLKIGARLWRIVRIPQLTGAAAGLLVRLLSPVLPPLIIVATTAAASSPSSPMALPPLAAQGWSDAARRGSAGRRGRVAKDFGARFLVAPLLLLKLALLPLPDFLGRFLWLLFLLVVLQSQLL